MRLKVKPLQGRTRAFILLINKIIFILFKTKLCTSQNTFIYLSIFILKIVRGREARDYIGRLFLNSTLLTDTFVLTFHHKYIPSPLITLVLVPTLSLSLNSFSFSKLFYSLDVFIESNVFFSAFILLD